MKTPKLIEDNLESITVDYINFDGDVMQGDVICNKSVSSGLKSIFEEIFALEFPINLIKPVSFFNNSDIESVSNNNSSCFNFRMIIGSDKLSDHSTGNAIDINPIQNPWVHPSAHKIEGLIREYKPGVKGTIDSEIVSIFKKYGWSWGGDWKNPDYQHFFKADNDLKRRVLNQNLLDHLDEANNSFIYKFIKRFSSKY